jgi:2-deoxy-D-gluconate 3-dehydrogenase
MNPPAFSLENNVALVTGASRGIGQGIAKALAEAGADVAGVSRSASTETQALVEATGRRYLSLQADLATASVADLNGLVERTAAHFGQIDILVNNAGMTCRKTTLELTEDDWNTVLQVNFHAVFFLCQAVGRYMVPQGRGKIINIASLMSFQGGLHIVPYAASKHGVAGITRALATDWAPLGVNVNAIAPGYIDTDMTEALQQNPTRGPEILGRIPVGRWGAAADIGKLAVYLASPEADYMHGSIVPIDGGWLAR